MAFENLVAMNVIDEERYPMYREAMRPLLESYGGGFRFDFGVQTTHTGPKEHPVTRVFGIYFRDREACQQFFADPRYAEVRKTHFEGAVDGFTVLAEYDQV
ncbi:MAG: DUF1330 domain-containing protein [Myxococcota bacterium]